RYISMKSPGTSQMLLQKKRTGAGRHSVDPVVGTHDGRGLAVDNTCAKGGQIGFLEVNRGGPGIECVPRWVGAAVNREMLSRGHGLQIVRVGALHPLYESHVNARGKKQVFAVVP